MAADVVAALRRFHAVRLADDRPYAALGVAAATGPSLAGVAGAQAADRARVACCTPAAGWPDRLLDRSCGLAEADGGLWLLDGGAAACPTARLRPWPAPTGSP